MKTVPPAKPAHRCLRIITLEIPTPGEGNLRLGVNDNHTRNGCWIPSLIQNLHRIHSQRIEVQIFLVVSEPWSSTHEPNGRRLPNSPTAKCSKERCQSLVPSMEIPTKTWLPCVTGGLCYHISCSFSFRFTLDPIKSLPPGVCNKISMGWGAPKVVRTETIFAHGQYHVDVDVPFVNGG